MTRTTTDGTATTPAYRFTAGYPDAVNTPDSGFISGKIPVIFMTGGDVAANADPAGIGADRLLKAFTDNGYSVCQPNVPIGHPPGGSPDESANIAFIGNDGAYAPPKPGSGHTHDPGAIERIQDALTWGKANLGWLNKPPILMGASNGWVCSIIYARQYAVSGVIGILPVVDSKFIYDTDAYGYKNSLQYAWGATAYTDVPLKGRPLDDVANYPNLRGKILGFYSGNDEISVGTEMQFLAQPPIMAEMHNLGAYGHLGTLSDATFPCAHVDVTRMMAFVAERVAAS